MLHVRRDEFTMLKQLMGNLAYTVCAGLVLALLIVLLTWPLALATLAERDAHRGRVVPHTPRIERENIRPAPGARVQPLAATIERIAY